MQPRDVETSVRSMLLFAKVSDRHTIHLFGPPLTLAPDLVLDYCVRRR
jgi:hypothetical protein